MRFPLFLLILIIILIVTPEITVAQDSGLNDKEPLREELGAPVYPGAVFIRMMPAIHPYTKTAMYISLVPMEIVEDFFNRKLTEKRVVFFSDQNIYMTAYLLKTWSKFPDKPKAEDLSLLEAEPSLQLRAFDSGSFRPLVDYYVKNPANKDKVNVLQNGKTVILYTYNVTETFTGPSRIIGLWKESSRDLPLFSGSTLEFSSNGEYTWTYTTGNLDALIKLPEVRIRFKGKSDAEIRKSLESLNPEKGKYVIMNNTITMSSGNPVDGIEKKSGLAKITSSYMSLELINKPRLTFIKSK